ncbi:neuronal membrane glycoprotein M6-a-like isoform X2 [Tachypleus tridentatus]|uniref:neuronal membrane glycoprotein M6-a-like isoform X2 n=1 Tax=Tachypleus tridentatus TaxID=6853 RepID=UPI003FCF054B
MAYSNDYCYLKISHKRKFCGNGCCGGCFRCMARVPYATLIATVMCFAGSGVFLGSMYKGVALTLRMFEDVFQIRFQGTHGDLRLTDLRIIFIVIGGMMGVLSLFLLLVGCLATGATRERIYRGWKARLGGRISCALFLVVTYILDLAWILVLACLVVITFVFMVSWGLCNQLKITDSERQCIDLTHFDFMFPSETKYENLRICSEGKVKEFCKDYVEQATIMYLLATAACVLVVISLVHYLICLSANYAHIKDNEKFQDLQELQYLQDTELGTLTKDRF